MDFKWEDRVDVFAYTVFHKCELLQDMGPFKCGTRFSSIIVDPGSGTVQFVTYDGKFHSIQRLIPRVQPYYMDFAAIGTDVCLVKRRRLNPMGEDIILAGNHVYYEKQVVTNVQRIVKDRLWRPGGAMYRKLSYHHKGLASKRD